MRRFRSLLLPIGANAFTVLGLVIAGSAHGQMTFNLDTSAGISNPAALTAFNTAAQRFTSRYNDNITLNFAVSFRNLPGNILGGASTVQTTRTYSAVRNALIGDATSLNDATAVASLPLTQVGVYMNRTSNNPNGANSATPYVDADGDANNTTINLARANAKALGLLAGNDGGLDATIEFDDQVTWDFDPSNGITPGALDFVGVATHEFGHAMGFFSGVDILDNNGAGFPDSAFTFVNTLDLYRYSNDSFAAGVRDFAADNRNKYFSINGGVTRVTSNALFSTGVNFGDGNQASHWKADNITGINLGMMDPSVEPGFLMPFTGLDNTAFDVIGYNVVPAPSAFVTMGLGIVPGICLLRHRRNKKAA